MADLADTTGGQVIPAEQDALGAVFSAQADALAQQLLVTFDRPEDAADEVNLGVTVDAGGTVVRRLGLRLHRRRRVRTRHRDVRQVAGRHPGMLAGALALALGLAGLLAVVIGGPNKSSADRRLDAYFGEKGAAAGQAQVEHSADLRGSAVALTDRVVSADLETRVSQRLAGAGSALTASEWLLLHAGIAIGSAVLGFVMKGPVFAVLGLVVGRRSDRGSTSSSGTRAGCSKFNGQLAETLGLMAGGLQAGLSLPQAVDSVVQEGNEPMAGELRASPGRAAARRRHHRRARRCRRPAWTARTSTGS